MVPVITELMDELQEEGAVLSRMTGSGSAVFGIFEDAVSADKAYETLKKVHEEDGAEVFRLKSI